MPQVKQIASISLKNLCLHNILANIDRVWCRHYLQRYHGTGHFIFVLGPFDDLPPSLIQELWLLLKSRKMLRKHHIYLLVSPFAKSIDLSGCDADLSTMLLLTGQRCFALERLSLAGCKLPKTQLSASLPLLTRLTNLSFSKSSITDSLLSIVGLYCPLLTSLDISYCTAVSDQGLCTLFLNQDSSGQPITGRFGQCTLISSLLVSGSQGITDLGASQAILHLPHLAVFDYHNTVAVITSLVIFHGVERLKLRVLHGSEEEEQDLATAIDICPQMRHLHLLTHPALRNANVFQPLLKLSEMKELRVCNEAGLYCLPVLTHLTPVISQHGQTLVSLNLAEVCQIDVGLLATLCPALVHLSLLWNSQYLEGNSLPPNFFPKLRTAELSYREREDEEDMLEPPQDHLAIILSSPMLSSLKLSNSANLTDHLLSNLLISSNSCLQLLQLLHLTRCNEVTLDGLRPLLLAHNYLDTATFSKCEEIGLADFQEYQKKAKKMKWNIQLLWS